MASSAKNTLPVDMRENRARMCIEENVANMNFCTKCENILEKTCLIKDKKWHLASYCKKCGLTSNETDKTQVICARAVRQRPRSWRCAHLHSVRSRLATIGSSYTQKRCYNTILLFFFWANCTYKNQIGIWYHSRYIFEWTPSDSICCQVYDRKETPMTEWL